MTHGWTMRPILRVILEVRKSLWLMTVSSPGEEMSRPNHMLSAWGRTSTGSPGRPGRRAALRSNAREFQGSSASGHSLEELFKGGSNVLGVSTPGSPEARGFQVQWRCSNRALFLQCVLRSFCWATDITWLPMIAALCPVMEC